jgi:hypothetical protein
MIANLLKLNVQDHVEKKNGLTYLSWAWAWAEALKADPTATFHVDTFQRADGTTIPYMEINGTAMVWVRTALFSKEMTCMLPVMDHRNKPIQNPDAFQVNTAIMRCLTKCLAMHGLGLYIYAGEDLPEDDGVVPPPKPAPKAEKPPEKAPAPPPPAAKPPAKMAGEAGRFQITVKTKPDATNTDFINIVSEAAVVALEQATSQAEVMQVFQVNRALFDKVKSIDPECHKDLMSAFKTKKDSFQ